ncbi:MAG: isoprenyl transferase [Planctomycetes bacterium]|nr:isoprenyl transferase [Planctomycetota bacterium]
MDGNGRWARTKGWMRVKGHEEGARAVRETTEACAQMGIEQLTLYAFSTENWRRPKHEVAFLMGLLERYLIDERPTIMRNNVRLTTIGHPEGLPESCQRELRETLAMSAENRGVNLCLALNYGARQEIVDATRRIAQQVRRAEIEPEDITEETIRKALYQPTMRDPDLLIRTAGEMRISNFLLWQISYSELWVTAVHWPEFRREHLEAAIADYRKRERRYGGL